MLPSLADLGWDAGWESDAPPPGSRLAAARVAAVDRELLLLAGEEGFSRARLSGRLRREAAGPEQRPCVGDWVWVARAHRGAAGRVERLLPRRTLLARRAAGSAGTTQPIAANVDTVVVVQSCHFDFNLRRLERYLVMARESGATPLVLLTKTDLVSPDELASQLTGIREAGIEDEVLTLSNVTGDGLDALVAHLEPRRTYCFVGSSGVGKSTLINALLGGDRLPTAEVSGTGEGRHTTVRRELHRLAGGALVIDNPGMRELGMAGGEEGLAATYADIEALAPGCRFRDCTHTGEPGCAVQAAIEAGELDAGHAGSFDKLRREAERYRLTELERKRRERTFGRLVKAFKKERGGR
ncbi:MAG: ribosome small subunit-dependent GTPase A [Thermoanaerobaculia bacterium]|nr:ribosome small subunit-dependent GTPase A [Thermoanaerobaculia bacterium]